MKTKRTSAFLLGVGVFWFTQSGCSLDGAQILTPPLDSSVNGERVAYAPGVRFQLELHSLLDAGYHWYCAMSDTTVVCLDSTSHRPSSGNWNMEGGLDITTFHFRTKTNGECSLLLEERRPWLRDAPPINTIRFTVVVFP